MIDLAPYRKGVVAAVGLLGQALVILDQAEHLGVLPASWVPWVQLAVAAATAAGVHGIRNAPLAGRPAAGRDAGAATAVFLLVAAGFVLGVVVVLLLAMAIPAGARPPAADPAGCRPGYLLAEVHLPGQWIGSGIDPVTHLTRPELVASAHPDTAARYVVALACIRDLTEAERAAERAGLSVPTEPLPFPHAWRGRTAS